MNRYLPPPIRLLLATLALVMFAGGAPCSAATPPASTKARLQSSAMVDVNSADARTLETLPGVGPVLAQRIIDNRPYRSLADLEKVKGLGQAKVAAFKDSIIFGPAPTNSKPANALVRSSGGDRPVTNGIPAKAVPGSQPNSGGPSPAPTLPRSQKASTATGTSEKLAPGEKINLNKATAEQLTRLPGIGPAKARAIVEYRAQNGDFKTIESIQQVRGIKAGVFFQVKDHIKLTD